MYLLNVTRAIQFDDQCVYSIRRAAHVQFKTSGSRLNAYRIDDSIVRKTYRFMLDQEKSSQGLAYQQRSEYDRSFGGVVIIFEQGIAIDAYQVVPSS